MHSTQVSLFFTAVRAYVFNSAGAKVVARLRVLLFGRMLAQETAWFDARETGDLLSRLASDTQKLQAAATETVSLALRSAISALVSFALLFLTSWRLACLATAVVPFLIGATFLAMRVVKRLAKESQAALARAGAVAQEGLANQRVARSMSLLEDQSLGMAGSRSMTAKISTDAPTASTTEAPVCARTDSDAVIVRSSITNLCGNQISGAPRNRRNQIHSSISTRWRRDEVARRHLAAHH